MTYLTIKFALWFVTRMYESRILVASASAWILRTSNISSPSLLCILGVILVREGRVMFSIVVSSRLVLSSYVCSKDFIFCYGCLLIDSLFMHEENAMNRIKIDVIFMCS